MKTTIQAGPFPVPLDLDQRRVVGCCLVHAVSKGYDYSVIRHDGTEGSPAMIGITVHVPAGREAVHA